MVVGLNESQWIIHNSQKNKQICECHRERQCLALKWQTFEHKYLIGQQLNNHGPFQTVTSVPNWSLTFDWLRNLLKSNSSFLLFVVVSRYCLQWVFVSDPLSGPLSHVTHRGNFTGTAAGRHGDQMSFSSGSVNTRKRTNNIKTLDAFCIVATTNY